MSLLVHPFLPTLCAWFAALPSSAADNGVSAVGSATVLGLMTGVIVFRTKRLKLGAHWMHWASLGYRQARRVAILIVGLSVVGVGCAMLVLPGPAIVVIPLGLAILALEFAWAGRWLRLAKERAEAVRDRVRNGCGK